MTTVPSELPVLRPGATNPSRRPATGRVTPAGASMGRFLSLAPAATLFAIFFVVPIITVVTTSFSEWTFRSFEWIGLSNYQTLLADEAFWRSFRNTLIYSAAGAFIQVPLGVLAGVLIARRMPGWKLFRTALFVPVVISGPAFALTFTAFYNPEYGLLNTILQWFGHGPHNWLFDLNTALPAVIGTYVFILGIIVVLVVTEILSIPGELYEAAQIDGANWLQRELFITLPQLRQIIGTCLLLTLLDTLKLFDVVYIMTKGGPAYGTATLGTYAYERYLDDEWGYANAIAVMTIVTGLLVILSIRRLFGEPK